MNTMNTPRLMSDTPKTDEFILSCVRTDYNWQILARHLESELNAAKQDRANFGVLVDKLERELNAAVRRMDDIPAEAIEDAYWSSWEPHQNIRNLFIQAAKGKQP